MYSSISSPSTPDDNDHTKLEHETSIVGGAFRNIFRTFVRVFRFEALGSLPRRVPTRAISKSADTLGQVDIERYVVCVCVRSAHLREFVCA